MSPVLVARNEFASFNSLVSLTLIELAEISLGQKNNSVSKNICISSVAATVGYSDSIDLQLAGAILLPRNRF